MTSESPPKEQALYFCDESSFLGGEEYMAVGGLALPRSNILTVVTRIKTLRGDNREEVKWTTTKHWNIDIRKGYVDLLADLVEKRLAHLHIRFAPFNEYDHDDSGSRKHFDTVSKMYYQLLLHRAVRYYGKQFKLSIRPDDGECTSELQKFIPHLRRDGASKYQNCLT